MVAAKERPCNPMEMVGNWRQQPVPTRFMLHSPGKNLIAGSTMNLARMMTDKVFFEDQHGTRSGPYKTRFGTDRITVFQDELKVTEGDRVIQPLADGTERFYMAEAVTYNAARRNIPGHFSITIAAVAHVPDSSVKGMCATDVEAGDNNSENLPALIQSLAERIEHSGFSAEQKDEARHLLRTLVEHPVVAAVLRTI